jgi:hypothetical protein
VTGSPLDAAAAGRYRVAVMAPIPPAARPDVERVFALGLQLPWRLTVEKTRPRHRS